MSMAILWNMKFTPTLANHAPRVWKKFIIWKKLRRSSIVPSGFFPEAAMTKAFLMTCTALWLPLAAFAQSTVTLDSFSLDLDPEPDAAATEMRDCLLDPSACASNEFGGGASFTLDDVVNLGVVKREPKPVVKPGPNTTSIAVIARDQPKAEPLPTIDIEVLFAYDSDNLTPQAMGKLSNLATALRDPRLRGSKLIFIGHTDAVGSASYNNTLSLRRAQSVASFVQGTLGLPRGQIEAVGVGFSRLKNLRDPASAQNRRVQLVLVPGT
jgi:OOP family OmpA-OmpF porin